MAGRRGREGFSCGVPTATSGSRCAKVNYYSTSVICSTIYSFPGDRPNQNVNFTACPARVNVNEQQDGTWLVTKANNNHLGHLVCEDVYKMYPKTKIITEEDESYLLELSGAGAAPRTIAALFSSRTGNFYKSKDVSNLIKKLKQRKVTE